MKRWTALLLVLLMLLSQPAGIAEEMTDIQWYPIGRYGNCFLYGETDRNGSPRGFVVYEDNQGNTHYGVNTGTFANLWDGVCIIVNREDSSL